MLFRSDRKSTRLNSSHTIISYAVFCLKKKKRTIRSSGGRADPGLTHGRPRARSAHGPARRAARGVLWWPARSPGGAPLFFFFNDPAPPEISTLSLPDALPI